MGESRLWTTPIRRDEQVRAASPASRPTNRAQGETFLSEEALSRRVACGHTAETIFRCGVAIVQEACRLSSERFQFHQVVETSRAEANLLTFTEMTGASCAERPTEARDRLPSLVAVSRLTCILRAAGRRGRRRAPGNPGTTPVFTSLTPTIA